MRAKLRIDLGKLAGNAAGLAELCGGRGINLACVTKCFSADRRMVEVLARQPLAFLADSRLANIARYPATDLPRLLLRAPAPDDCDATVRGADISVNSEMPTIEGLARAGKEQGIRHGIVVMVDMGDLREGLFHSNREKILETAAFAASGEFLDLQGIGVNLTCYGGVIPDEALMGRFADLAAWLQQELRMTFKIVSGGNSSSLDLVLKGGMPAGVNNLRLGESIITGEEAAYQRRLPGLAENLITLEVPLIEIQVKPSVPEGNIGLNAFREKPHFEDMGLRKRGILAIGRQDTEPSGLCCLDPGVRIIGASSDHMIVDLTEAHATYAVGDTLRFTMNYLAMLRGFTSEFVDREYC